MFGEECCQVNDSTEDSLGEQLQFNSKCHLGSQELTSGEVTETLADPGNPSQELTPNEVIEALVDLYDLLGLNDKVTFDMDVDLEDDLDHIITTIWDKPCQIILMWVL